MRPPSCGRAKVFWPSPPYVVPIRVNSVSFWEMGINWPWHMAQPAGAKLPPNMRISPTNGLLIALLLVPRREDTLQRDDEVHDAVGLLVLVRLAAADVGDGGREQGGETCGRRVQRHG